MLTSLQVNNFAIITSSTLDFNQGMTTLTGETGAGKSILLGALGMVLGDRASPGAVRDTAERAEITAVFDVSESPSSQAWLADHSLDEDNECILRRVVTRDGKSRAYVNGTPVTVRNLRELGQLLVNIHGQHDHQLITLPDTQRVILDDFGNTASLLKSVGAICDQWHEKHKELADVKQKLSARGDRLDTLRYQLQEFSQLDFKATDFSAIDIEHRRLANATELKSYCEQAMDLLQDGNHAALTQLAEAQRCIEGLTEQDKSASEISELLSGARIQTEEAIDSLRHYGNTIEPHPERLQELDNILSLAHQLAKKHQVDLPELAELAGRLQQEMESLESIDGSMGNLEAALDNIHKDYQSACRKLTKKRNAAAKQLTRHLTSAMQTLGMKGGQFEIKITPRKLEQPAPSGVDQVVFHVSANPGAALRPMSNVASGGELSRLSLAVQLIASKQNQVPTLIFDEVDTGVGGGVAETVGQQLRQLGNRCQVLCVTHLPQVAAQGHHHIRVAKKSSDNKTLAESKLLSEKERLEEIARMLGGVKITRRTREHASEMLDAARNADEPVTG